MSNENTNMNKFVCAVKEGLFEVFGSDLIMASEPGGNGYLTAVDKYLQDAYSISDASGLAFCAGRNSYTFFRNAFDNDLGFSSSAFKTLPPHKKTQTALDKFVEVLNMSFPGEFSPEKGVDNFLIIRGIDSDIITGQIICGLIQQMLCEVSGGHLFSVELDKNAIVVNGDPAAH